jgi:predicted phosphodiesterase
MDGLSIRTLPAAPGRTIIIGDIHGCADELEALLEVVQPAPGDRIIAVGDLINRGPSSDRVLRLARRHGILPILGNHEQRFLAAQNGKPGKILKNGDRRSFRQLESADWDWVRSWPHVIQLPELNALVVHGGFAPFLDWPLQRPEVVTRIQVLNRKLQPAKRSESPTGRPWADLWDGPEQVYYGHTPRPAVLHHPYATGLDTGCVYGGHLSAMVLPERQIVQIKARDRYLKSPALAT